MFVVEKRLIWRKLFTVLARLIGRHLKRSSIQVSDEYTRPASVVALAGVQHKGGS
jgi:hypothetical protein